MSEEKFQPIPEVEKAILEFREQQKEKSYSERHSELGRMLNCPFCDRRHRSIENCTQRFAKDKNGVERIAKGRGHGKGRLTPHWNRRSLELVDLTRQLIPTYPEVLNKDGELEFDVKKARSRALNTLRKKWHKRSSKIQRQKKLSRRINRG